MSDLAIITKKLGSIHSISKKAEKELKESRSKFFDAIDKEIIATEILAQQIIAPSAGAPLPGEDLDKYIATYHPGWRFVEENAAEQIIIEEDPSFKKFVYVNTEDGQIYRRNVSQSGPFLDNDRLKKEDPELWNRITEEQRIPAKIVRTLKNLETLPDKDLAAIQEYFVPGPMTVRLEVKPDELDD